MSGDILLVKVMLLADFVKWIQRFRADQVTIVWSVAALGRTEYFYQSRCGRTVHWSPLSQSV